MFISTLLQQVPLDRFHFTTSLERYILDLHDMSITQKVGITPNNNKKYRIEFYISSLDVWHEIEVIDRGIDYYISTPIGFVVHTELSYEKTSFLIMKLKDAILAVEPLNKDKVLETKILQGYNVIITDLLQEYRLCYVYNSRMYNGITKMELFLEIDNSLIQLELQYSLLHYMYFFVDKRGTVLFNIPFRYNDSLVDLKNSYNIGHFTQIFDKTTG